MHIFADGFAQGVLLAQVAEGLDPADQLAVRAVQQVGRHAHRAAVALSINDLDTPAVDGLAALHGFAQSAVPVAHRGAEDGPAGLADGLGAGNPGNGLGSTVERGDAPLCIDGEYALGDRIEDRRLMA